MLLKKYIMGEKISTLKQIKSLNIKYGRYFLIEELFLKVACNCRGIKNVEVQHVPKIKRVFLKFTKTNKKFLKKQKEIFKNKGI